MASQSLLLAATQKAFSRLAPFSMKEHWDNVGLLLEAPFDRPGSKGALLVNDLTPQVASHILSSSSSSASAYPTLPPLSLLVVYHPPIFKPLNSLTLSNPLQSSLLKLAAAGISVISFHTASDASWGGVGDWLAASCVWDDVQSQEEEGKENVKAQQEKKSIAIGESVWKAIQASRSKVLETKSIFHQEVRELSYSYNHRDQKAVISPINRSFNAPAGQEGSGTGRFVSFGNDSREVNFDELVGRVKRNLGLEHVQVARSVNHDPKARIKTIAICAGSGDSIVSGAQADCYLTGELSHHSILAAVAKGRNVILCNHTNTERPFLPYFRTRLEKEINAASMGILEGEGTNLGEGEKSVPEEGWRVFLSESDKEPLEVA